MRPLPSMGQVRRDYLPSLRSFLTDERHANLLRLIPPVVMTPNRTLVSPKTRTWFDWSRPGKGLQPAKGFKRSDAAAIFVIAGSSHRS